MYYLLRVELKKTKTIKWEKKSPYKVFLQQTCDEMLV